ncbi:MAG TPA: type II toxin-antitoxin system YafQ family toxin [Candidatus Paceibacterota bacterium]|nr:type II toxin-antitoxin system YafQ family toxin [Candidatus Paceibacterota bacterium]
MLKIFLRNEFTASLKRLERSGTFKSAAKEKLENAVRILAEEEPLPSFYVDHQLTGEWRGYRECHIKGNVLLIYQVLGDSLILVDIGSHSYLLE